MRTSISTKGNPHSSLVQNLDRVLTIVLVLKLRRREDRSSPLTCSSRAMILVSADANLCGSHCLPETAGLTLERTSDAANRGRRSNDTSNTFLLAWHRHDGAVAAAAQTTLLHGTGHASLADAGRDAIRGRLPDVTRSTVSTRSTHTTTGTACAPTDVPCFTRVSFLGSWLGILY